MSKPYLPATWKGDPMLGRRSVVLTTLVSAATFGGGAAAFAATHGGSTPARKPAAQPVRISNMHYGCHHHDTAAATPPL
jgi:hypothetical protein